MSSHKRKGMDPPPPPPAYTPLPPPETKDSGLDELDDIFQPPNYEAQLRHLFKEKMPEIKQGYKSGAETYELDVTKTFLPATSNNAVTNKAIQEALDKIFKVSRYVTSAIYWRGTGTISFRLHHKKTTTTFV